MAENGSQQQNGCVLKNYFSHGDVLFERNKTSELEQLTDVLISGSTAGQRLDELNRLISSDDWNTNELLEARDADQRSVKVSVVHVAAAVGDTQVLELLKDRGADINVRDSWGRVPLHVAAWYGHNKLLL